MENKISLSFLEAETIRLLAEELSDAEIAESLNMERITVKIIIDNLMAKTNTKSLISLIKEAVKRGWIV